MFWIIFFCFSKKLGFRKFLVHLETKLPNGLETSGQRVYRKFWHISRLFEFCILDDFFCFSKNSGFLGPPYCGIGATIRIGREMLCLPYAGNFYKLELVAKLITDPSHAKSAPLKKYNIANGPCYITITSLLPLAQLVEE